MESCSKVGEVVKVKWSWMGMSTTGDADPGKPDLSARQQTQPTQLFSRFLDHILSYILLIKPIGPIKKVTDYILAPVTEPT
jgi:hypothetical protein